MSPPVSYLQTDPRWRDKSYSARGEATTIGASGCGPTAMAMVLATWADPAVTPATECAWALAHGYKAPHQGTYYGYFVPAAARYGLVCRQRNGSTLYGNAASTVHDAIRRAVEAGDLAIACMGPGNWTRSGHYVLVWGFDGDRVLINDPASTKAGRIRGDWALFRKQVKFYWIIQRPGVPDSEEVSDMTEKDVRAILANLGDEEAYALLAKALRHAATLPEADWSRREGHWLRAQTAEIIDGSAPERPAKRAEVVAMLGRLGLF